MRLQITLPWTSPSLPINWSFRSWRLWEGFRRWSGAGRTAWPALPPVANSPEPSFLSRRQKSGLYHSCSAGRTARSKGIIARVACGEPWGPAVLNCKMREAPWSAAAKLPPWNPGRTAAASPPHSIALRVFSWFPGARQRTGMSDCPENDCAVGGADIAFYVGATGRIHTRQCMRHPHPFSWFPGARQRTGMSDCPEIGHLS